MATEVKKTEKKPNKKTREIKKSKSTLFWEKYPNGLFVINDMKAVMR